MLDQRFPPLRIIPRSTHHSAIVGALTLLIALSITHAATATPVVDLGTAADYAILAGPKETVTFNGGLNLSGNLGVGQSDKLKFSGSNAIAGTEYKDSKVTTTGSASIAGGIITASLSQAMTDATDAASAATALSATPGLTDQGSSISVNGGDITIKALTDLSENVLNISSLSLTNGTITFDDNGFTDAKFIVNVAGGFSITSNGTKSAVIRGINGADASDILFNIEGTGSTVSITGNSSNQVIGTILAPQRNVSIGGGGTLTGALIAGINNAGKSYTVTEASSGYDITGFAYKPSQGGGGSVSEPSSLALYCAGLAALIALRSKRRVSSAV